MRSEQPDLASIMPQLVIAYTCARLGLVPSLIRGYRCCCGEDVWSVRFREGALNVEGELYTGVGGHFPELVNALRNGQAEW